MPLRYAFSWSYKIMLLCIKTKFIVFREVTWCFSHLSLAFNLLYQRENPLCLLRFLLWIYTNSLHMFEILFLVMIPIGLYFRISMPYLGDMETYFKAFFFQFHCWSYVSFTFTCVLNNPSTFPLFLSSWYFILTSLKSECGKLAIHHCLRALNLATESVKTG